MKRCIIILILFCYYNLSMATITMTIEPNPAQLGETFSLTLTNDDIQSGGIPDLIPLQQNFKIVGTERSMSYMSINGQAKSLSQWRILLIAKKSGLLPVPAIKIGHQQSQPGQIEITGQAQVNPTASPMDSSANDDEVSLTAEVSSSNPFINEQVIYTVKLYNSQRLLEAAYQPPQIEDALLIPLGDGRHYQTTKNGQQYAVDEQQYAIFPQKSGELTIKSPAFTALVYDAIPRRINVRAKEIKLIIKPVPDHGVGNNWLPAKQVTLTEHYDHDELTMAKGSTIERTITLRAVGVPAELLPKLVFQENKQFSVYSENPVTNNVLQKQALVGTTTVKVTYVLNKSGRITLPPVQQKWFNTVLGKDELASLPERVMTIEAKTGEPATTPPASPKQEASNPNSFVAKHNALINDTVIERIAIGLVVVWVMTLLLWWLQRRYALTTGHGNRLLLKRIKEACVNNNAVQARDAMLSWAKLHWPNMAILSINDIIKLVHHSPLEHQLHLLSLALYRENGSTVWQGDGLWRSILSFKPVKDNKITKRDVLPPINPEC